MAEIRKSGLIPVSTGTYATNYNLGDDIVGKYISLNGIRKFYNPGTDLTLAAPNTDAVESSLITTYIFNDSIPGKILQSGSNGNTGFFYLFNTLSPFGDSIPGTLGEASQIIDYSVPGISNLNSIVSQGNHRVINILTPGEYTFTFTAYGRILQVTTNPFHFDFAYYLNINGNETIVSESIKRADGVYVGGSTGYRANLDYSLPKFSQKFTLKTGDYVQLYGKGIADNKKVACQVDVNGTFTMSLGTTTSPAQTTFTNPLNIADFKTNSINLYGADRDTLVLQGTKLTNI